MIMLMLILIVILLISWVHARRENCFLFPDRFKTQKICIRAVKAGPWRLYIVPDWFVVLQEMWCEDFDDNYYLIRWCNA